MSDLRDEVPGGEPRDVVRGEALAETTRKRVLKRSAGCCEAEVLVNVADYPGDEVWTRCGRRPVEIHHALTRSRGGRVLDSVGEIYHLIALCNSCHRLSDGGDARLNHLLIDGYVTWNADRSWPVYDGPDYFLSDKYPKESK